MTKFSTSAVRVNVAAAIAAVVISVSSLLTVVGATTPLQTAARTAPSAVVLPLA